MASIKCIVVTPEAVSIEQEADFVAIPLFDGEKGIAHGHTAMIGRLGFGELRLKHGNETERFYVDGGFVQVENNVVSVMTSKIVPVADLDAAVAEEQIRESLKRSAKTPELMEIRDRAIQQARAQLRVAQRQAPRP